MLVYIYYVYIHNISLGGTIPQKKIKILFLSDCTVITLCPVDFLFSIISICIFEFRFDLGYYILRVINFSQHTEFFMSLF